MSLRDETHHTRAGDGVAIRGRQWSFAPSIIERRGSLERMLPPLAPLLRVPCRLNRYWQRLALLEMAQQPHTFDNNNNSKSRLPSEEIKSP